jgi:uncharacterized protein
MSLSPHDLAKAADLAREGKTDALAALLTQGLSPDTQDEKGNPLLMLAAYHGRTETVRMLLRAGAKPDGRNAKGQTPLGGVAFKGHTEIARLLLEGGADPEADQGGSKPADLAVTFGRREIIELLQTHSARAAQPTRWYSRLIGWLRRLRGQAVN